MSVEFCRKHFTVGKDGHMIFLRLLNFKLRTGTSLIFYLIILMCYGTLPADIVT